MKRSHLYAGFDLYLKHSPPTPIRDRTSHHLMAGITDKIGDDDRDSRAMQANDGDRNSDSMLRLTSSCIGMLADSYNLFVIDLVLLILGCIYGDAVFGPSNKSLIASATLVGCVCGQTGFGFIADWAGRRTTSMAVAGLIVISALISASVGGAIVHLPMQLAIWRFTIGLGIGGEYPLSATMASESTTDPDQRGRRIAFVFSMQGFGMLLPCVLAIAFLSAGFSLSTTWRALLAFGAVPSAAAFVIRMYLQESQAFEQSQREGLEGAGPMSPQDHARHVFENVGHFWKLLLGTASTWFLMNFSLYSVGSFKSSILDDVMGPGSTSDIDKILRDARFAAIISLFAITGFAAAIALINRLGRFAMQLGGFVMLGLTFLNIAALEKSHGHHAQMFLVSLGLMFAFQNCGPNTTTFVIAAEAFPTRIRATCHGLSAASGKLGAALGTALLPPVASAYGMSPVYITCAVLSALGAVMTFLFTPRHPVDPNKLEKKTDGIAGYAACSSTVYANVRVGV